MAVATDGRKPQPRRTAEREVELVLSRSPVNLANLVTVGRLLMVVPVVWLVTAEQLQAAFWLFVAAGISDALDGYIAKNFNAKTELGAYLDPLADKVLVNGIYVALALIGWLPVWLTILVISRDLLIVLGVILIQRRDPVFRAVPLVIGKLNTFCQILLAACALAHGGGLVDLSEFVMVLIAAVTLTTLLSGAGYAAQTIRGGTAERPS
jgi:cardiolipin synthase (CMP-forming)